MDLDYQIIISGNNKKELLKLKKIILKVKEFEYSQYPMFVSGIKKEKKGS
jgi:hypothetical protein